MTGIPALVALVMTALPLFASRSTMIRALTPALIMPSAMVWNLATSPPAFWMSESMPAASNAFFRNGRSADSQRGEEAESGRITPTLPLTVVPPVEPPVAVSPPLLEPPQAVRASRPAVATAATAKIFLRIVVWSSFVQGRTSATSVHRNTSGRAVSRF